MKITRVIQHTIAKRLMDGNEDLYIQLSSVFMKEFRKELSQVKNYTLIYACPNNISEITYNHLGRKYSIENRKFIDDTNSPDFEETLITLM